MAATAKKMLSVFMAFVLVFTLAPTVAWGEGEETDTDTVVVNDTLAPAEESQDVGGETENETGVGLQNDNEGFVKEVVLLDEEEVAGDADADGHESEEGTLKIESLEDEDSDGDAAAKLTTQASGTYNADDKVSFTYESCSYSEGDTTYNGVTITKLRVEGGYNGDVAFPSKIDDTDVIGVGNPDTKEFSFEKPGTVQNLTFPSSIKFVYGFKFASNVQGTVEFEGTSTITTLYDEMFQQFYGPTVILPSSLATVPARMFKGSNITSITLPDSVTTINMNAFTDTSKLATVKLNEGLQTIGQEAFAPTHNGGAISNMPLFETITIPASVTKVESEAFFKNINLKSLDFASGSSLSTIGDYAFYGTGLTSVSIPDSVMSIGVGAFSGKNGNATIDGDENLGGNNGSYTLASVTFGSNSQLTTLGARAFARQPITSVALPDSLTPLGYDKSDLAPTASHPTTSRKTAWCARSSAWTATRTTPSGRRMAQSLTRSSPS